MGRFHISAHVPAKNAPDFTLPNKDIPKTRPVLGPNLWRGTFGSVCFCAPTRVHEKNAQFHTSAHGYTKNPPDFTITNRDAPKTHPVLHLNHRRRTFRGVCFCALHGYMQNLAGFIFPHPDAPKNAPDFTIPNRDTPKTCPILDPNPWRRTFRGVCNTPLHGYVQNPPGFIFPHTTWHETRRVSYSRTRHGAKPDGFWTLPHDMARNPAGF